MRDRRLTWGGGFLVLVAVVASVAPWFGLRDPNAQPDGLVLRDLPPLSRVHALHLADGTTVLASEVAEGPGPVVRYRRGASWTGVGRGELAPLWHERPLWILGTDALGRDLFSRLVWGARVSLAVGLLSALGAVGLGLAIGLTAGLAGGAVDGVLMRATDLALAVPRLFLALLLVALHGVSTATTILVIAVTTWMAAARLVRGEVLSLRERDFVRAARAAGASPARLSLRHLLPALVVPVSVEAALRVGDTILLESSLSFLGLGVPPPLPSWGSLVADGRASLLDTWWVATFPGLAIAGTVIALNLLADAAAERVR